MALLSSCNSFQSAQQKHGVCIEQLIHDALLECSPSVWTKCCCNWGRM